MRRSSGGYTLLELLVVLAIAAVLAALILAAVQKTRAAAARADCQNRLRQLALALHQHHDRSGVLPPGHRSLTHPDRLALSGWTLSVLPFLDQTAVADQSREAYAAAPNPFTSPPHVHIATALPAYACPADDRVRTTQTSRVTNNTIALTSYLGVSGRDLTTRDGLLHQDSAHKLAAATDGTSQTLLLGERPPSHDFQYGWWYAGTGQLLTGSLDLVLGVREQNRLPVEVGSACGAGSYAFRPAAGVEDACGVFHFWSPHPGGANFAFADGSVRFLTYAADGVLPALASRTGGETASVPD